MSNTSKKALIIALGALILVALAVFFGVQIYLYNSPDTSLGFGKPVDLNTDRYCTMPVPSVESRSIFGMSDVWNERMHEIVSIQENIAAIAVEHDKHTPYHFETSVDNSNGKTVITLAGTYTENGEQKEYQKKWELDYIFSDNIINN